MNERDIRISKALQRIAKRCERIVAEEVGEECGVTLFVHPWSAGGSGEVAEFQYVSNAPREHMHGALKALVEKWDRGDPHIPPHEKQ